MPMHWSPPEGEPLGSCDQIAGGGRLSVVPPCFAHKATGMIALVGRRPTTVSSMLATGEERVTRNGSASLPRDAKGGGVPGPLTVRASSPATISDTSEPQATLLSVLLKGLHRIGHYGLLR